MSSRALRRMPTSRISKNALRLDLVRQEPRALGSASSEQPDEPAALPIERNGERFAGSHFMIDLYGARRLDDLEFIERTLRECIDAAGASLVHLNVQPFGANGHMSALAVLTDSHIAIHAWPAQAFAAIDIFSMGTSRPECCIEILLCAFSPRRLHIEEKLRGGAV